MQRHRAIVSVTLDVPLAWFVLESMPTSMAVEINRYQLIVTILGVFLVSHLYLWQYPTF